MAVKQRLADRFEHRLREADDSIGVWGWLAIVIAILTLVTITVGFALALDHFDNIAASVVGFIVGGTLIAATSPGWATSMAVRRHRRRLGARRAAFCGRRDLADQMYATGRIDAATHRAQADLLDPFLAGTSPGDASRVASSWARIVGGMALLVAMLGGTITASSFWWDDADIEALILSVGAPATLITAIVGIALWVVAAALSLGAAEDNRRHADAIEAGHAALLKAARESPARQS